MKINRLKITLVLLLYHTVVYGQVRGWERLDLQKDSIFGMSINKAYKELLQGKKSNLVIVAVVDCGTDTAQQDLKNVLWTDPANGNHGWNFIGKEAGKEDVTNLAALSKNVSIDTANYGDLKHTPAALKGKIQTMQRLITELESVSNTADTVTKHIGKANPTAQDFLNYRWRSEWEAEVISRILRCLHNYPDWQSCKQAELTNLISVTKYHLQHGLNPDNTESGPSADNNDIGIDPIGLTGEQNEGGSWHGTHVAGIIGAMYDKEIGVKGVADNVRIMTLKVTGNVRELRDESLAGAIRYATNHGAKIINMSFGKSYSWNKKDVDAAVQYAMSKNVLIIAAAGNDGRNLDKAPQFPNPVYVNNSGRAKAWLEVGASGYKNDSTLCAKFSNYGRSTVDVFAPGVKIYSTLPNNCYDSWSGTSMATPAVSGVAALLFGYFPKLTAVQVHDIIIKSVVKSKYLADKCTSGGVVNTYDALKLAASISVSGANKL